MKVVPMILGVLLLLSGCATGMQGGLVTTPPVLQVPLGQAALVYADAKVAYTVTALRLGDLCKAGKLTVDDCAFLDKQDAVAKQLDADIRKGILAAQGQIDWEKVMKILEVIAGMAVKFSGL